MDVLRLCALSLGGAVLANAVPHLVSGLQGRPFQTPFARPPGVGSSSSTINVVWGSFNLVLGYGLTVDLGRLHAGSRLDVGVVALGGLGAALVLARAFGRLNGGNDPRREF